MIKSRIFFLNTNANGIIFNVILTMSAFVKKKVSHLLRKK